MPTARSGDPGHSQQDEGRPAVDEFVVNVADDGRGAIELAQYNVKATGHVDRLRRTLRC